MFHAVPHTVRNLLGVAFMALVQACGAAESPVALPAPAVDIPAAAAKGPQKAVF